MTQLQHITAQKHFCELCEQGEVDQAKEAFSSMVQQNQTPWCGKTQPDASFEDVKNSLYQIMIEEVKFQGWTMVSPVGMVRFIQKQQTWAWRQKAIFNSKAASLFNKVINKLGTKEALEAEGREVCQLATFCTFEFAMKCYIDPDEYAYNPLMKAFEKEDQGAYVIEIFEYMERTKVLEKFKQKGKVTAASFMIGALLSSRSRRNGLVDAERISERYDCSTDGISSSHFAHYHAKAGKLTLVWELFQKMPCNKFIGNAVLIACSNLASEPPLASAQQAVIACLDEDRRMLNNNSVSNGEMYMSNEQLTPQQPKEYWGTLPKATHATVRLGPKCLEELRAVSKWSNAVRHFLEDTSRRQSVGNLVEVETAALEEIRNELAHILAEVRSDGSGQLHVVMAILDNEGFRRLKLDGAMYNNILKVCALEKKPSEAEMFIKKMKDNGVDPQAKEFNSLMCAYLRVGMSHKVADVLKRMEDAHIEATEETRCMLVKSFNETQIDTLTKSGEEYIFSKGLIFQLLPDCIKNGNWNVAEKLYFLGIKKGFYSPYRYEANTLDLHEMSYPIAEMAWRDTKLQLEQAHAGHFQEGRQFSPEKDLRLCVGKTGYKLREYAKKLVEKDNFAPEVDDRFDLVIKSESVKQWLSKAVDRWNVDCVPVVNTFLHLYPKRLGSDKVTASTTDARVIGGEKNVRRSVPAKDISAEPLNPEASLDVHKKFVGVIRSYDDTKGNGSHGFIECEDIRKALNKQVYMYKTVFETKPYGRPFAIGDEVSFCVHFNAKNEPQAKPGLQHCAGANVASSSSGR